MNLLTMKDITKAFTDKILFDRVDFSVSEGEKIGILGINGTGKTTLLKIIAGLETSDSGSLVKRNNLCINYLPQHPQFPVGKTIYEYVITENETEENRGNIEGDAKTILNRLGFADYETQIAHLSGGQKKKVALAAALLSHSEILILDEPTNHLDNDMTEWLEQYLRAYKGALIMVTHDRYFLDLVCNRIVEIDKGHLYSYDTNYEGYLMLKAEREDSNLATQKKHAGILRKELEWMRRGARARSTKQKAHIQRFEALNREEKIQVDDNVAIHAISTRLGKKTIELNHVTQSYGERRMITDFSYIFLKEDRIGILGPNGCGKTTLLKVIMGLLPMESGTIEIGDTIKIGYYSQDSEALDDTQTVIGYIRETAEYIQTSEGMVSASQMLENFLFVGALQYALIGKLSGGEKRRLYLLKVLMEAPNVLILDEPTNDLDIQTLCILEDYLDRFSGILITVSHDRYFLDRVAKRMLTFEGDGVITQFNGSYTEYFKTREEKSPVESKGTSNGKIGKIKEEKIKFTYQEQREYDTIEQDIEQLEEQITQLNAELYTAATDFVKLNKLTAKIELTEQQLNEKMERYLYLSDLADKIMHSLG
ncbi:MAG: ABC-F family ATP-binding cassette domain-containing protein [Lachnospiraceae bacterium]